MSDLPRLLSSLSTRTWVQSTAAITVVLMMIVFSFSPTSSPPPRTPPSALSSLIDPDKHQQMLKQIREFEASILDLETQINTAASNLKQCLSQKMRQDPAQSSATTITSSLSDNAAILFPPDWASRAQARFGSRSLFAAPETISQQGFVPFPMRSRQSQDAFVYEIFFVIGETSRIYVDFGDGSNTEALHERGWQGVVVELPVMAAKPDSTSSSSHSSKTSNNKRIVEQPTRLGYDSAATALTKHNVSVNTVDYLSLGGQDQPGGGKSWFLLFALLEKNAKFRPRVISINYQSSWLSDHNDAVGGGGPPIAQLDPSFGGGAGDGETGDDSHVFLGCAAGSSPAANIALLKHFGYVFLGANSVDQFFLRKDLVPQSTTGLPETPRQIDDCLVPPFSPRGDGGRGMHFAQESVAAVADRRLVDVSVLLRGGSLEDARKQAAETVREKYVGKSRCWFSAK